MSEYLFVAFARTVMCIRECVAPDRTHELNEQAVCDINMCLDQLQKRADSLSARSDECMRVATTHAKQASREMTVRGRAHELALAKRQVSAAYPCIMHAVGQLSLEQATD